LVHKPPLKGSRGPVISGGRYSNANELRMIAPNSKATGRAAFSNMIAAPAKSRSAPKTHAMKVCAGIHAGNLGKTRVTKSR
jgi:hypothetical protein